MKSSHQDRYYLEIEGDRFFERNAQRTDRLTTKKQSVIDLIAAAGIVPRRVIEYGCNIGDKLDRFAEAGAECYGVEPSAKAVAYGKETFGDRIELIQGSIADNAVNADPKFTGYFDLVVIDDVLCWVSRETIFQSIANIDDALADGGYLFLREFFPGENTRNVNHHTDGTIYCHKTAELHARMFTASGIYAVISQRVYFEDADDWAKAGGKSRFESRWADTLFRKSFTDYFD